MSVPHPNVKRFGCDGQFDIDDAQTGTPTHRNDLRMCSEAQCLLFGGPKTHKNYLVNPSSHKRHGKNHLLLSFDTFAHRTKKASELTSSCNCMIFKASPYVDRVLQTPWRSTVVVNCIVQDSSRFNEKCPSRSANSFRELA